MIIKTKSVWSKSLHNELRPFVPKIIILKIFKSQWGEEVLSASTLCRFSQSIVSERISLANQDNQTEQSMNTNNPVTVPLMKI